MTDMLNRQCAERRLWGRLPHHRVTGNGRGILKRRGHFEETRDGRPILITINPSALLRIPNARDAAAARQRFREDLSLILQRIASVAAD